MTDATTPPAVRMRGIVKRFGPTVLANAGVDLTVADGEIHAVMGENGAGKSTLMSILYGLQTRDAGTVEVRGKSVDYRSPSDAIADGLGMVHQEFKLFDSLSVAMNVVFGDEPRRRGVLDRGRAEEAVAAVADRHGLRVDPTATVGDLPIGIQQRVEILKALRRDASILILDEPTAVLTPQETDELFEVLRGLAADGRTILLVTHKLHEVMALTDRITVLRDGRTSACLDTPRTTPAAIARAMTERDVELVDLDLTYPPGTPGEPVLEVSGLHVDVAGRRRVRDVDLTVRAGEIVGIAAVAGSGQEELIRAIAGLLPPTAGSISLRGRDVADLDVRRRRDAGVAYIPEDRAAVGSVAEATLEDNLLMGFHEQAPLRGRGGLLQRDGVRAHARSIVADYDIRTAGTTLPASALSGGNRQKLIVGREMAHDAPLLLAEQPTRGVDIGAVEHVHQQLRDYRDAGHAVLLSSSELNELLALSDRILVMYDGRVVDAMTRDMATAERLGLGMAGDPPAREGSA